VAAKLREIGSRPAAVLPDRAPILHYLRAVDSHLGIRSHLDCSSTDANIPLSVGIPAISLGAGGRSGGAHTLEEWYDPAGRELGLQRVALTSCRVARTGIRRPGHRHRRLAIIANAGSGKEPRPGGGGAGGQYRHMGTTFVLVKAALRDISPLLSWRRGFARYRGRC
jgi:hypothetical protein